MDDDELIHLQRDLRRRLFEGSAAVSWRPGRELAAQLLLYLDDPQACWRITTDWLRDVVDADRVDGGFGGHDGGHDPVYRAQAETRRDSLELPSVLGVGFDARDPGVRIVWTGSGLSAIDDVREARFVSDDLRRLLLNLGTASKLALAVRHEGRPIGLVCADWHRRAPRWNAEVCNQVEALGPRVLGPVLAAAHRVLRERRAPAADAVAPPAGIDGLATLTPAERNVARLVGMGLTYKEVARQLDRSLSTVDHQLRSIREKLGVRSTARLVHVLSQHAAEAPAGASGPTNTTTTRGDDR